MTENSYSKTAEEAIVAYYDRDAQMFQISRCHLKIVGFKWVKKKFSYLQHPQILGATIQM
jgi:hypothetical protein